jgi:hypothetical protein
MYKKVKIKVNEGRNEKHVETLIIRLSINNMQWDLSW